MPIRTNIDHPNRLVIGIGEGVLTIQDLVAFGLDILKANIVHYGKIVDVAACQPGLTAAELDAFGRVVRETRVAREATNPTPRGPLAIVVDRTRGEMARLFADMEIDGRPADVFGSLREARQWMTWQMQQAADRRAQIPPLPQPNSRRRR